MEVFYFYKIKKNYTHTILKNFETGLITKPVLEKIHNHQKSSRSSSNNPAYDAKGNDTAVKTRQFLSSQSLDVSIFIFREVNKVTFSEDVSVVFMVLVAVVARVRVRSW